MEPQPEEEEALAGGLGSAGAVVKVGSTVRRPSQSWTPAVHALLRHFEQVGFRGAPGVRGFDDRGREILDYIPGDVAVPPFPAWSADLGLLVSVAGLQRDAHLAARSFVPEDAWTWGGVSPPVRFGGRLVCHNDICLENVVVRGGRAAAFIDWDWARPVDRLWDIAVAARHWIPLRDPVDIEEHRAGLDLVGRCRMFFDEHQLGTDERRVVIDALLAFLDGGLVFVRQQAEAGHAGHRRQWNAGYAAANRRAHAWITVHQEMLTR